VDEKEAVVRLVAGDCIQPEVKVLQALVVAETIQLLKTGNVVVVCDVSQGSHSAPIHGITFLFWGD